MASARRKLVSVRDHMGSNTIKVECARCYDDEGSWACIRPSHEAYKATHGEEPVTQELLAGAILSISDSVKALFKTGLNKRAVIALIADDTKLGKGTISAVLNSIADLQKNYTTPKGTNSRGPM